MSIDLQALKTELTTDPDGLGYTGSDITDADILNAIVGAYQVDAGTIEAYRVVNAIVPAEWPADAGAAKRVEVIISAGLVDASDANVKAAFADAFGAGTASRANLLALATRDGSRAESLFGTGTAVTTSDCANARRA